MLTRRQYIGGLALTATSVPGCLSVPESVDDDRPIARFRLLNHRRDTVDVSVHVTAEDSVKLDETYTLEPRAGLDGTPATTIEQEWMHQIDRYTIEIDASTMDDTYDRSVRVSNAKCYEPLIQVLESGAVDQDVELLGEEC